MSYDTLSAVESNAARICGEIHFVICLQMRKQLRLITYILFAQCHGTRDPSPARESATEDDGVDLSIADGI